MFTPTHAYPLGGSITWYCGWPVLGLDGS